jgi:hypothetical protein
MRLFDGNQEVTHTIISLFIIMKCEICTLKGPNNPMKRDCQIKQKRLHYILPTRKLL